MVKRLYRLLEYSLGKLSEPSTRLANDKTSNRRFSFVLKMFETGVPTTDRRFVLGSRSTLGAAVGCLASTHALGVDLDLRMGLRRSASCMLSDPCQTASEQNCN